MLSIIRLPLTSLAVQKAYNAINSKSGLMIQQLPHHCQQQQQHHQSMPHSYEDKSQSLLNRISSEQPFNETTDGSALNGPVMAPDISSQSSSLSSSSSLSQNNGNNCETKSMISTTLGTTTAIIKDNKCSINSNTLVSKSEDRDRESPYGTIKSITNNKSSDKSVAINNNNNNLANDWHKVKRRPVVDNNEIEQELAIQVTNAIKKSIDSEPKMPVLSQTQSESNSCPKQLSDSRKPDSNQLNEIKIEINLTDKQKSDKSVDKDIESDINLIKDLHLSEQTNDETNRQGFDSNLMIEKKTKKDSDCLTTGDNLLPNYTTSKGIVDAKRAKGNLKNQLNIKDNDQINSSNGTHPLVVSRRVSFDPLALLLDAALEGELELVKRTAKEVSL